MGVIENRFRNYVSGNRIQSISPDYMEAWNTFMERAGTDGALSPRRKELIAVSLSIASKCDWCIRSHVKNALELGARKQEIVEAAWVAVLMGGDPVLRYAQWAVQVLEEYAEIDDDDELLEAQVQLALEDEYKRLYQRLLDYVKYICNEAETMCEEKSDRRRLAINIAETDGNVLGLLVTKECQKRGWGEPRETTR
ncbi:MAG: carboxymuconolactone decarboxylase family protein [Candidatus Bathyarchaeota archaeon]|nr:MAG: carboxymuconolactone decarboxylase family protein [Candidatus Bathyarchaeota archaeon]